MKRMTLGFIGGAAVAAGAFVMSPKLQFLAGGAMVNAAYKMQSTFPEDEKETPEQAWEAFKARNEMAAKMRDSFPRPAPHPSVAMLVCMDARIDTAELAGDTRRTYYVVRTAGSVMDEKEEEMLELAAVKGVKLIIVARHTDCAAEKAAKDPEARTKFPALVKAVEERDQRFAEFLARPIIAERIKSGQLLVKHLDIDTANEHLSEHANGAPVQAPPPPPDDHHG